MGDGLTDKQRLFCHEYLKDLNGTQAAIRAGYSEESARQIATENLSKPSIEIFLQQLMAERVKRVEIDADYVLLGIKELTERCIQAVPVTEKDGTVSGEYKFEANAALKGYELLGKHLKLFTDKVDIQPLGKDGLPTDPPKVITNMILSKLSSEELEAAIEQATNPDNN